MDYIIKYYHNYEDNTKFANKLSNSSNHLNKMKVPKEALKYILIYYFVKSL